MMTMMTSNMGVVDGRSVDIVKSRANSEAARSYFVLLVSIRLFRYISMSLPCAD